MDKLWTKEQLRAFIKENNLKTADDAQQALKELFKDTIQEMLEAELETDLGGIYFIADNIMATNEKTSSIFLNIVHSMSIFLASIFFVVKPLAQAFYSPNYNACSLSIVSVTCKEIRKTIRDARAVKPLIKVLEDKDIDVRRAAVYSLGEIRDGRAVKPLIMALKDEDFYIRGSAVDALGKIGEPAVEPLIVALKDEDDSFRQEVARALGQIGEPDVEPLVKVKKDNSEKSYVRSAAAEALRKIGKR